MILTCPGAAHLSQLTPLPPELGNYWVLESLVDLKVWQILIVGICVIPCIIQNNLTLTSFWLVQEYFKIVYKVIVQWTCTCPFPSRVSNNVLSYWISLVCVYTVCIHVYASSPDPSGRMLQKSWCFVLKHFSMTSKGIVFILYYLM